MAYWTNTFVIKKRAKVKKVEKGIGAWFKRHKNKLILIGLGCAPIYPSIIHSTPILFGKDKSQAIIGVEMAFAYIGCLLMPPLFGFIATYINISLFTLYLFWMCEILTPYFSA